MFSVIFEVQPKPEKWDEYLGNAKMLRPELEQIDGFIDNIRYKSMQREGWLLSLSGWRDEKSSGALAHSQNHHLVQEKGRDDILEKLPPVCRQVYRQQAPGGNTALRSAQRRDGNRRRDDGDDHHRGAPAGSAEQCRRVSQFLGLDLYYGDALVDWDVFDAVLSPGDLCLMLVWKDCSAVASFEDETNERFRDTHRIRHVRVVRDYTMLDRREAPQYYPRSIAPPTRIAVSVALDA